MDVKTGASPKQVNTFPPDVKHDSYNKNSIVIWLMANFPFFPMCLNVCLLCNFIYI